MPVLAPNVVNTLLASRRLRLVEKEDDARVFEGTSGVYEIYVPSDHGGRLRVGFGRRFRDPAHGLVLQGPDGSTARADTATGEAHLDFAPGKRGNGICNVYASAPSAKFSLYALFDEVGFARDADGSPLIPWNFWYFPYSHKEPHTAWDSSLVAPLQRYMEAFGSTSALAWELEHHGDAHRVREGWEGHCDDAAAASILFTPPADAGLEYNGIHFKCEDLKFYAIEYFGRYGQLRRVWTLNEPDPGVREGFYHQFKPNDNPPEFGREVLGPLIANLRRFIRDEGMPLRLDMRDANGLAYNQLWNHAVYQYAIRYWQPDASDPRKTEGRLILSANADFLPQDGTSSGVPADVKRVGGQTVVVPNGTGRDHRIGFSLAFDGSGRMNPESNYNEMWSVRLWDPKSETELGELLHAPRDAWVIMPPWEPDFDPPGAGGNPHILPAHVRKLLHMRKMFR